MIALLMMKLEEKNRFGRKPNSSQNQQKGRVKPAPPGYGSCTF